MEDRIKEDGDEGMVSSNNDDRAFVTESDNSDDKNENTKPMEQNSQMLENNRAQEPSSSSQLSDSDRMKMDNEKKKLSPHVVDAPNEEKRSPKTDTDSDITQSLYHIKWIIWLEQRTPIVTQNENGPCPLIAIFNVLLLSRKVILDGNAEILSTQQIMAHIANVIWENMPKELPEHERLNYEQNVSDAMSIFPNLLTGLDVNVKFSSVASFEYTQELTVYDLLRIPLYHGWLIDPQDTQVQRVIGNLSYNQIVEKIILNKSSDDQTLIEEALIAEQFLESTASQITCHGIVCLCEEMQPGSLAVLFRNNHFSTLYRHKEELFTLVTDLGFLRESNVVWETLSGVQGDSHFVDGAFLNSPPKSETNTQDSLSPNTDYDLEFALSLQQEQAIENPGPSTGYHPKEVLKSDFELARSLQEEENRRHEEATLHGHGRPHTAHSTGRGVHGGQKPQRPVSAPHNTQQKESNCSIL